jgi:competence protein ComGC
MHRVAGLIALLGILLIGNLPALAPSDQKQEQKQKKSQPKKQADSMTGCIDQQADRYVLIDQRSRDAIADLEAEGFPAEGFAKHLGQKVIVRGTVNQRNDRPLFRVRSIETVSESCEPRALE